MENLITFWFQVLRRDLVQAIRKKRPGIDLDQIIIHQDNAPGHRAQSMQLEIGLLGFETLEHPPYTPDVAPMDFWVFPEIKAQLRGRRFDSGLELQIETKRIVSSFDNIWYEDTYDKWVKSHRKCIAVNGDYVEKWVDMTIGEIWH